MTTIEKNKILSELKDNSSKLRKAFNSYSKEDMAQMFNDFYTSFLNHYKDDKYLFPQILLEYFYNSNYFGQHYSSLKTFENLIKEYEKTEIKNKLSTKYPIEFKLTSSTTYIMYYSLLKENYKNNKREKEILNKDFSKPLMKAKSKLSSLYSLYLSSKKTLNNGQLIFCLENLGFCYSQLSRWYEALYYIEIGEKLEPKNINLHFVKYSVLERIQNATCTNFSKQLILSSLESIEELKKDKYPYPIETKLEFDKRKNEIEEILQHNKITIESIKEHRTKGMIQFSKRTNYLKFCSNNNLFLSEHSLHCNCNRGIQDKITIKTSHEHTNIDFLIPFEEILESVAIDFTLARKTYFNSLENEKLIGYQTRFSKIDDINFKLKIALLKDSFRLCYSVLDTIAIAIIEALEIDYVQIRKEKSNLNIHFSNIWDDLITDIHFHDNFYLQTLYSISEDINARVGGHKEFRQIRNSMEHKIFKVSKEKNKKSQNFKTENYYEIEYLELIEKTMILLVYTKSLIHTYTYFMRRLSINKSQYSVDHKLDKVS